MNNRSYEIQVLIDLRPALLDNCFGMEQRIHKRLPVEFVKEVLQSFNTHRISEKEAMVLLGIERSHLRQFRKRWLLSNKRKPFRLWSRTRNAFLLLSPEVRQWLDEQLHYIQKGAQTFRGKFNFAFLAEEAQKRFQQPFCRNSLRLYALITATTTPYPKRRERSIFALRLRDQAPYSSTTLLTIFGFQTRGSNTTSS